LEGILTVGRTLREQVEGPDGKGPGKKGKVKKKAPIPSNTEGGGIQRVTDRASVLEISRQPGRSERRGKIWVAFARKRTVTDYLDYKGTA